MYIHMSSLNDCIRSANSRGDSFVGNATSHYNARLMPMWLKLRLAIQIKMNCKPHVL